MAHQNIAVSIDCKNETIDVINTKAHPLQLCVRASMCVGERVRASVCVCVQAPPCNLLSVEYQISIEYREENKRASDRPLAFAPNIILYLARVRVAVPAVPIPVLFAVVAVDIVVVVVFVAVYLLTATRNGQLMSFNCFH